MAVCFGTVPCGMICESEGTAAGLVEFAEAALGTGRAPICTPEEAFGNGVTAACTGAGIGARTGAGTATGSSSTAGSSRAGERATGMNEPGGGLPAFKEEQVNAGMSIQ